MRRVRALVPAIATVAAFGAAASAGARTPSVIRVGGPNGDSAARKLVEGDLTWFSDYPDKRDSIGGRFANFILCRGEHLTVLTESYLREVVSAAGFVDFRSCRPGRETGFPQWFDEKVLAKEDRDFDDLPHTLLVEAVKPA